LSYLDKFTTDQRELLTSLPYRAGLWVSESDESGGDESQEAELKTLENLIIGYSEDFLKSEFIEELMKETLSNKNLWEEWSRNLDTVPQQCHQAIVILEERMDSKDILSFRQALMEIATAVAMAYREFNEEEQPLPEKYIMYAKHYWHCFMARLKQEQLPSLEALLNISGAEHQILLKLSQALQLDMEGNPRNVVS